jgi:hypothetical protein
MRDLSEWLQYYLAFSPCFLRVHAYRNMELLCYLITNSLDLPTNRFAISYLPFSFNIIVVFLHFHRLRYHADITLPLIDRGLKLLYNLLEVG